MSNKILRSNWEFENNPNVCFLFNFLYPNDQIYSILKIIIINSQKFWCDKLLDKKEMFLNARNNFSNGFEEDQSIESEMAINGHR